MTALGQGSAPVDLSRYHDIMRAALHTDAVEARAAYDRWIRRVDLSGTIDHGDLVLFGSVVRRLTSAASAPDDEPWNRLRGAVRRQWTENRLRLVTLDRVSALLQTVNATAAIAPGALSVAAQQNDVGVVPIAVLQLVVEPRHARRSVAALLAGGAVTEQDVEPFLDHWFPDHRRLDLEIDGAPLAISWDHDDVRRLVKTAVPVTIGSRPHQMVSPLVRFSGYLSYMGDPSFPVGLRLICALGLRSLAVDPCGDVVADAARGSRSADRHGIDAACLEWVAEVSGDPAFDQLADRFRRAPRHRERGSVAAPVAAPRRPVTRLAAAELRHYQFVARSNHKAPTIPGLGMYVVRRGLEMARRSAKRVRPQP